MKKVIERPPSGHSQRSQTPNRSRSMNRSFNTSLRIDRSPSISRRASSPAVSLNETTRLRHDKIRQSIEKSNKDSLRHTGKELQKLKQQIALQKKVTTKAQVNDPARNRTREMVEKLRSFREADSIRRKEYQDYLRDIDAKLDSRPLLFERESQTNARRKAQKRYEEILEQAGVKGDVLQSVLNASGENVSGNIETETESERDVDSEQDETTENEVSNQPETEGDSPDNNMTYGKSYDGDNVSDESDEEDLQSSHDGSYVASPDDQKSELSDDEI